MLSEQTLQLRDNVNTAIFNQREERVDVPFEGQQGKMTLTGRKKNTIFEFMFGVCQTMDLTQGCMDVTFQGKLVSQVRNLHNVNSIST